MRRPLVLLAAAMALLLAAVPALRALTDDELRQEFLQARGDMGQTPSPVPSPSPSPHHRRHAEEEATPHHRHTPEDEETPAASEERAGHTPEERPIRTPEPYDTQTPIPRAAPAPTPPPNPTGVQVDIEKEGLEEEGGLVPPPPPPPVHRHWWQFFGGEEEPQYSFLTKAIRDAIDRAPVARHRWRFIVVHNSGTRQGNARIFDYYHRYVRKMPNGLAYHFVIGNGTSSGNGQIEIGNRWTKQLQGGHVHSDYLNNISLGICLVGDFNRDLPTKEQLEALDELIRYLRIRVGKIDRKPAIVKAHKEINPPQWPTDCPGDRFPYHWLHERFD
ncbi:MAG: peptidoglycan recognition family protein [Chthoniobacteraceae bacterium]